MKEIRFAKLVVFCNGAVPLALLLWDASRHELGANPVNHAIHITGMFTLVFVFLSLLVTPVRKTTGWNWLIFSRRTLGLYAFFYGCTHFLLFFGLDRSFSLSGTVSEMLKRKYLLVGATGLLLMVPLAATSTRGMIRRLGGARWRALHRLVYVTATAGVLHYYLLVKADRRRPLAFAAVLALLFGFRLIAFLRRSKAPRVAGAVRSKRWSGSLRVESVVEETPDVRTFRLVAPDGGNLPFVYAPGQYLILSLMIAGKRVTRTYTIASAPTRPGYCELTIKREEHGLASRYLHDHVRAGDLLKVAAPAGRFTFDGTGADSVVLIAGGVGITPLMSILRCLTDRHWPGDIHFLYSGRTPRDIIFRRELEALQARCPNLHLVVTLTRAEGVEWTGRQGRISTDLLKQAIPNLAAQPVFICGPAAMMEPTMTLLHELGVPDGQIRSEAFLAARRSDAARAASGVEARPGVAPGVSGAAASPDVASTVSGVEASSGVASAMARAFVPGVPAAETGPPALTFAHSARRALLSPGKTLLELAEEAGLEIDYECRSGICGRCKTRLLAGWVTMEVEDGLDESDKAQNLILLCQARSTDHVTIEA